MAQPVLSKPREVSIIANSQLLLCNLTNSNNLGDAFEFLFYEQTRKQMPNYIIPHSSFVSFHPKFPSYPKLDSVCV